MNTPYDDQPGGYPPYPGGTDPGYPSPSGPSGTAAYLHGAPVSFGDAVLLGLRNLVNFRGRASRSAFWWFLLFTVIAEIVIDLMVISAHTNAGTHSSIPSFVGALLSLSVAVRRLHDSDHRGWWWLIGCIPVIGWIPLVYFYLKRPSPGPNRFDPPR